jgi:RHS repeat-associated protein
VVSVTNNLDGTRSQNFTYDQLNRLKTAQTQSTTGGNCWGLSFTYDNWANLTAAAVTQCTAPMLSIAVDTNNRVTTGFSYDLAGNSGFGSPVDSTGVRTPDVTADGSFTYAWNAESEMKTAAGVTYAYDGLGNRVSKSNGKLYWYGMGSAVLDESDLSGNITNEYVYFGGQRVARRDASGNLYYYVEDMLGTSRALTTANGTVCYDADFYPFGGERTPLVNTCPQNFKFNGKERDPETGLDDFGARYFSSSFGRWLSPDWSAIPAPVPYANLTNPQTLNLYQFVGDNPETFSDLDGHEGIMAMSGIAPPSCAINACSESTTLYGDRGTAGNGFAPPILPDPIPSQDEPQAHQSSAPVSHGPQNQITILGNSVPISYATGLSDADRLAASNAISAAAAAINGAQSQLTQSQIADIKAVKGISVVPTEPYANGTALGVSVTNKGTRAAVAQDLHISAKIGTYVLNASQLSKASTGYLASSFVHEGVHIIDRASESAAAEHRAYAAQLGVASAFHLTAAQIQFLKNQLGGP